MASNESVDESHVPANTPQTHASASVALETLMSGSFICYDGSTPMPLPGGEDPDVNGVELPVLQHAVDGDEDNGAKDEGEAGSGAVKKVDLREIPDSDAISPPSSLDCVGGSEGMGNGGVESGVRGVEVVVAAMASGNKEKEEGVKNLAEVEEERSAVAGMSHVEEAASSESTPSDPSSPNVETITHCVSLFSEEVVYLLDNRLVSPTPNASSAPRSSLSNQETFFEDAFAVTDAAKNGLTQSSNPVAPPPKLERESEDSCPSPMEEAQHILSPLPGGLDTFTTENTLPMEGASFLQRALLADEALTANESLSAEDNLHAKEVLPSEIPPSDDEEDAMDEDTDPLPNIFEFHTTHGSSSENPDTFFMNVQATRTENQPILFESSIGELEAPIITEASSAASVAVELDDAPVLNVGDSASAKVPASNTQDLSAAATILALPIDSPKAKIMIARSNEKELPEAEPEPQLPKRGRGRPKTKDKEKAMKPAVEPEVEVEVEGEPESEPEANPEPDPEIRVHSSNANQKSLQASPLAQKPQVSMVPSTQQNDHDGQATEISTALSKRKESSVMPSKASVTPNSSFTAPSRSTLSGGGSDTPAQMPVRPNASFTAPDGLQNKRKLDSTPSKAAGSPKELSAAADSSHDKDVLFDELKAMKIASIQARNSSLEAEIAAKRAKLEEVTKELESPAAKTVKRHIKLLHDYNDIRDVGQGLVGMIADNRGVRIGELYDEFGVGLKD